MRVKEIVHRYYQAWAAQRQDAVRDLLADNLIFRSPQDAFNSADLFLSDCWKYSSALTGVVFREEVYDGNKAVVVLQWTNADGSTFTDAEYLHVEAEKIQKILVVNNDTSFGKILS